MSSARGGIACRNVVRPGARQVGSSGPVTDAPISDPELMNAIRRQDRQAFETLSTATTAQI